MNRKELNELFGITEDDSRQGVVDLEGEDTDEGAEELEEFDEGGDEEDLLPEDKTDDELLDAEGVATPRQSPEENHNYAAARKEAEAMLRAKEAEYNNAVSERDTLLEALHNFGYKGDISNITDALRAQAENRSVEEVQQEREAEEERLREALEKHPDVLAARELKKDTILRQQADELARIQAKNPEIQSIGQLLGMEGNAGRVLRSLVKDGMHIDEAYEIVADMMPKRAPEEPKIDTKAHLKQVNVTQNAPAGEIPRQQYELAKMLMPNASKKEIQEYYEKNKR